MTRNSRSRSRMRFPVELVRSRSDRALVRALDRFRPLRRRHDDAEFARFLRFRGRRRLRRSDEASRRAELHGFEGERKPDEDLSLAIWAIGFRTTSSLAWRPRTRSSLTRTRAVATPLRRTPSREPRSCGDPAIAAKRSPGHRRGPTERERRGPWLASRRGAWGAVDFLSQIGFVRIAFVNAFQHLLRGSGYEETLRETSQTEATPIPTPVSRALSSGPPWAPRASPRR